MEHEIIFRGKRIDKKEWVFGNYCHRNDGRYSPVIEEAPQSDEFARYYDVVHESIGRFTEKRDKNLRRIYEDDIIKTPLGNIGFIKFGTHEDIVHSKEASCAGYKEDSFECTGWLFENIKTKEVVFMDSSIINGEIIGNIFDNPELLNKEL